MSPSLTRLRSDTYSYNVHRFNFFRHEIRFGDVYFDKMSVNYDLAIKVIVNLIYSSERASEYKYVPSKSLLCTFDNANHVQSNLNALRLSLLLPNQYSHVK